MLSHKTSTILLSVLLATMAYAQEEVPPTEVSPMEICKELSIIGRSIMTARQVNKPMSETLPVAVKQFEEMVERHGGEWATEGEDAQEAEAGVMELVAAAYEIPAYSVDQLRQTMISDFENGIFAECYKEAASAAEK